LPPSEASSMAKPVTFPPGRSSRGTMRWATGSLTLAKTIGIVPVCRWTATVVGVELVTMMSGCKPTNSLPERSYSIAVIAGPMKAHPHVAAIAPTQARKPLSECREASLLLGIAFVARHEHADPPHAVALLRARRERPSRRAPNERDERAAVGHSITTS